MKTISIAVAALAVAAGVSGCSDEPNPDEQYIYGVREYTSIAFSDAQIIADGKEACAELKDSTGIEDAAITLLRKGYTTEETGAVLNNAREVYCPEN